MFEPLPFSFAERHDGLFHPLPLSFFRALVQLVLSLGSEPAPLPFASIEPTAFPSLRLRRRSVDARRLADIEQHGEDQEVVHGAGMILALFLLLLLSLGREDRLHNEVELGSGDLAGQEFAEGFPILSPFRSRQ